VLILSLNKKLGQIKKEEGILLNFFESLF